MFWLSWLIHPFAVCDLRCVNDSLRRTRTSLKVVYVVYFWPASPLIVSHKISIGFSSEWHSGEKSTSRPSSLAIAQMIGRVFLMNGSSNSQISVLMLLSGSWMPPLLHSSSIFDFFQPIRGVSSGICLWYLALSMMMIVFSMFYL